MPIIVKPIFDVNNLQAPANLAALDRRSDGFDPLFPYQMIPLGKTREMVIQTGDFKADLHLTLPDVATMFNFRMLRQTTPSAAALPGPTTPVQKVILPARSVVQFTLFGRKPGTDTLVGLDLPPGAPSLQADPNLTVSVKALNIRRVAVCYLFDRVHRDTGRRGDFFGHLQDTDNLYVEQANFSVQNIDGFAVNTRPGAGTVTLSGSIGKIFNNRDDDLKARVIKAIDVKFPGIFRDANVVLVPLPMPLGNGKNRALGINVNVRRKSDGRPFNLMLVSPLFLPPKAKQGGRRPSPVFTLRNTIAHELGHAFGLKHHPKEASQLPPTLIGKDVNPVFFQPDFHNLMFPTSLILADRLNAAQVENLHLNINPLQSELDF